MNFIAFNRKPSSRDNSLIEILEIKCKLLFRMYFSLSCNNEYNTEFIFFFKYVNYLDVLAL